MSLGDLSLCAVAAAFGAVIAGEPVVAFVCCLAAVALGVSSDD